MAAMENARYMKRRIKPTGKIDGTWLDDCAAFAAPGRLRGSSHHSAAAADFAERALVVHYEIEASVLDDSGQAMRTERKLHRKKCGAAGPARVAG